jgi:transposase
MDYTLIGDFYRTKDPKKKPRPAWRGLDHSRVGIRTLTFTAARKTGAGSWLIRYGRQNVNLVHVFVALLYGRGKPRTYIRHIKGGALG